MKRILKIIAVAIGFVLLALVGLIVFLSITEYKPEAVQPAERVTLSDGAPAGQTVTVCAWNIGYGGLGEEADFFMDGGAMVDPPGQETVEKNLAGIMAYMQANPADVWLLQEVDVDSARTNSVDELTRLQGALGVSAAFAYNYICPFVPIPVPPIGRVESGVATVTALAMKEDAERISLHCPFSWPVSAANFKRCLLVTRVGVEGSDKELVLVNLHLEAYDDGEGKIAQTRQLMALLKEEYAKGNYVIAGGDFNQTFPGVPEAFPIVDGEKWTPGVLEESILPSGWQFAFDTSSATCRLLDQPYSPDCQLYVIDGFILSPNVTLNSVETVNLAFEFSDHNPVRLSVTLGKAEPSPDGLVGDMTEDPSGHLAQPLPQITGDFITAEFGAPATGTGRFPLSEEAAAQLWERLKLDEETLDGYSTDVTPPARFLPLVVLESSAGETVYLEKQGREQLLLHIGDVYFDCTDGVDLDAICAVLEAAQYEAVLADLPQFTGLMYIDPEDESRNFDITFTQEQAACVGELLSPDEWKVADRDTAQDFARGWPEFLDFYADGKRYIRLSYGDFNGEPCTAVFYYIDGAEDQLACLLAPRGLFDTLREYAGGC